MKSRFLLIFLSLVLVLGMLSGCSKPAEEPDVIKIGIFEPMTGDNASGGQMTVEGIELAHKKFPEVLGKKIELVIADNKSEKVEAASAASKLIEKDKVVAIIGSYGSSLSMAAGDIVKTQKIPAVGCSPTNPLVTLDNDYYFRVCFIDPFQGTVMANYAFKEAGAKTAAIIQDVQNDYSVGLSNFFVEAFKKLTGDDNSIVTTTSYNAKDTDFSAQLTSIKALNPDVIFAPGNHGDSALLIKQARSLGIDVPILGGDTWESPEFIDIGGDAVEGIVFSSHFTSEAPVTETSKEFLAEYREEFGKDANAFAALGYDAYLVILDAIKKAGSADPVKIRDEIAKTSGFVGATGNITLDTNGDAVKSAVINQVQDGKFVYLTTVEP